MSDAEMIALTLLESIELACPNCGVRFASETVAVTNPYGGMHTDFRVRALGQQPLQHYVHTCTRCGYSGHDRDFEEDVKVSASTRSHVWDILAPKLSAGQMTGSEKYEFAARVAIWQQADLVEIAELWLRAAWCCADEHDIEAEFYYRRKAARMLKLALLPFGGVPLHDRAVLTYLVGEMWRRIGYTAKAHQWYDRVRDETTAPARQQWILDAARRQKEDPLEWFG